MEKKLKVAEFATLLGIVPKTVYKMIERNEIITVNERVNNRQTTLVVTSDEQINELKKTYSKEQVNDGNYYENVTDNNHSITGHKEYETLKKLDNNSFANDVIDRIITLNDGYNEQLKAYNDRLQRVNEELMTAKSKMLLLEDKAGREGLYVNEINELKKDNNRLKKFLYLAFTVIVFMLVCVTWLLTYNYVKNTVSKNLNQENIIQKEFTN